MDFSNIDEGAFRFLFFLLFIAIFLVCESVFPFYKRGPKTISRWITNFCFVAIDTLVLRICLPILAIGMAYLCNEKGIGLLNNLILPIELSLLIGLIFLDLGIWFQHLVFHRFNIFWRFHKIHHSDEEVDFSTGIRFHPVEIIISMLFKLVFVFFIGPTPFTVIVFEIILNGSSIFNHSNIDIPKKIDIMFRKIIVTPSMHRIHHSVEEDETNSNYGFNLSIWDKIFGTYKISSKRKEKELELGLKEFSESKNVSLIRLLIIPFLNK